jgi:putative zinc finger protein
MTHEQIADLAPLYALGALDDTERLALEAHVRGCVTCARVVGSAERDVALIAAMEARHAAPPGLDARIDRALALKPASSRKRGTSTWQTWAALAAALLVGLLPATYFWSENRTLSGAMLAQSEAMDRLAGAPHRIASFRVAPGSPAATVAYGADGSWYLVVVRDAAKALAVTWVHDGRQTMLGKTIPHGRFAMLYLPKSHRMDKLALMDGSRIVAEADLTWQKTPLSHRGARSG